MFNYLLYKYQIFRRLIGTIIRDIFNRGYLAFKFKSFLSNAPKYPNFIVMGAMKSGTTSLHRYLGSHRDIFMTYVKEPGIFMDNPPILKHNTYIRSFDRLWCLALKGYSGQQLIGESSTIYSEAPSFGVEVPSNIHKVAPKMKFVYLLRNPLSRIVSHFHHCLDLGIYSDDFEVVLKNNQTFLERSLYYYQLRRYWDYFPKEQFKIIIFEEFRKNPTEIMNEIFSFLGVSSITSMASHHTVFNSSLSKSLSQKNVKYFTQELFDQIQIQIKADVLKLENSLNRSLDIWDLSEKTWCS